MSRCSLKVIIHHLRFNNQTRIVISMCDYMSRFVAMSGQFQKRHVPYQNPSHSYTHYEDVAHPRMSERYGKNPQLSGEYPYQTFRRGQPISGHNERESRYNYHGMAPNGLTKWHKEIVGANRYLGEGNRVRNFEDGFKRQYSLENGIARDGEIHCEGVVRDGISLDVKRVHGFQPRYQGGGLLKM